MTHFEIGDALIAEENRKARAWLAAAAWRSRTS